MHHRLGFNLHFTCKSEAKHKLWSLHELILTAVSKIFFMENWDLMLYTIALLLIIK